MASIELEHISKLYANGAYGVRDVDLKIEDGEFVIFLGPSGCGKSTTLRMIAGLEEVSSGQILINGKSVTKLAPKDRNVAVVFQSYALYPHMNVRQNMSFGLKMRKTPAAEIDRKVAAAAAMLGLEPYLGRKPAALSGGQRQRVALGRAIVREADAFLLDEPLSNLDAGLRAQMRLELVKLHRQLGKTIIHVTHDQVEAMTMGDRICIMRDGVMIQTGQPMEIYANPVDIFVARFLSHPPMNLLPCTLTLSAEGRLHATGDGFDLAMPAAYRVAYEPYQEQDLILGVRPEDIYQTQTAPSDQPLASEIVSIERLGVETIIIGKIGRTHPREMSARLGRHFEGSVGTPIQLFADMQMMHLFDAATGKRLPRSPHPITKRR